MAYGSLLSDVVQSSTAGTPPQFKDGNGTQIGTLCRAWVNFNGTGTVAIRGSFNVSSITDNGTGDYTINFTTAMPDTNYSVVSISTDINLAGIGSVGLYTITAPSTTAVRVASVNSSNAFYDCSQMHYAVFR